MEGKIAAVAGSPTLHFPDRPCLRRLATLALITHVLLLGSRSIVVVDIPSETQRHSPWYNPRFAVWVGKERASVDN
jgi:hypothetical protein